MVQLIIMLVFFGGMMLFFQRSQKKQQQKRQETLDSMQPGSAIVTIGGLHGVISEVNKEKNTVLIDCEGIVLEFDRTAIRTVTPPTTPTSVIVEETPEILAETEVDEVIEEEKTEK